MFWIKFIFQPFQHIVQHAPLAFISLRLEPSNSVMMTDCRSLLLAGLEQRIPDLVIVIHRRSFIWALAAQGEVDVPTAVIKMREMSQQHQHRAFSFFDLSRY